MSNPHHAIDDITLDFIFSKVDEITDLEKLCQADDCIVIEAEFINSHNKKRLSVDDDFIGLMRNNLLKHGEITGYKHRVSNKFITIEQYSNLLDSSAYHPLVKLVHGHDENTIITYDKNKLEIAVYNLESYDGNRCNALLNVLIESDIFIYKPRVNNPAERNHRESFRQILKRNFYIKRYEWQYQFNSAISRVLQDTLIRLSNDSRSGITRDKNTFYLYDSDYSEIKVVVYNITAANRSHSQHYIDGDKLKLEIHYKRHSFKKHPEIKINLFQLQIDSLLVLQDANIKNMNTHLFKKLKEKDKDSLVNAAGLSHWEDFMAMLYDETRNQVSIRSEISQIKKDILLLQATLHTQNERQESQNERISKLEEKLQIDSVGDTRKLRAV